MWECTTQTLNGGRTVRHVLRFMGSVVSYRSVLQHWQEDESFRSFFIAILADCAFRAFRLETPPVTSGSVDRDFEFVLLDAPALDQRHDSTSFRDHFQKATADIATFTNLGGDAVLVVPCPTDPSENFGHLAAFVRTARASQVHALWQAVAVAMIARLGTPPIWLSTAGMGVPWLHVRLDSVPKYYGFAEYRGMR